MKRTLVLISILCFFTKAFTQEYTQMFEIGKIWNMYVQYDYPDGHYLDLIVTETEEIDGLTYHKIVSTIGNCVNYLREDVSEKKIYYRWEDEEYVLYDFNAEIGDELWVNGDFMEVTDIDYGDFYGMENLRYLVLDGSEKLIEGIGFENHGIAGTFEVGCLYLPIIQTIHLINMNQPLAINDKTLNNISLFPNPAQNMIQIESDEQILKVTIYSILGEIIASENGTKKIDVSTLQRGLYLIQVETSYGRGAQKFMKY
ncbi:MAG: T9SS type A sorting domain-containing protein [Flavobacteriaceae bacterium]